VRVRARVRVGDGVRVRAGVRPRVGVSVTVREVGPAFLLMGRAITVNTSLVSTETTADVRDSRYAMIVPVTLVRVRVRVRVRVKVRVKVEG